MVLPSDQRMVTIQFSLCLYFIHAPTPTSQTNKSLLKIIYGVYGKNEMLLFFLLNLGAFKESYI